MKPVIEPGYFKPTMSRTESRNDTTTRVAREIIDSEAKSRVAQMERLRVARLEKEAAEETSIVASGAPQAAPRKRRAPASKSR